MILSTKGLVLVNLRGQLSYLICNLRSVNTVAFKMVLKVALEVMLIYTFLSFVIQLLFLSFEMMLLLDQLLT